MQRKGQGMEIGEIKKIYARYSRIYDYIFKRWFYPRQQYVIQSLAIRPGQRVLDVSWHGILVVAVSAACAGCWSGSVRANAT